MNNPLFSRTLLAVLFAGIMVGIFVPMNQQPKPTTPAPDVASPTPTTSALLPSPTSQQQIQTTPTNSATPRPTKTLTPTNVPSPTPSSIPATPTQTPIPTPTPDTTPPTLDKINGPYNWENQGTCFTINGDQVHDNSSARPFQFAWALDGSWSNFTENEAIKCYQNMQTGNRTISAKVKDAAGNESNQANVNFAK